MRLVSYMGEWSPRAGVLAGELVVDSQALARRCGLATEGDGRFDSVRRLIQTGPEVLARLAEGAAERAADGPGDGVLALAGLELLPPIPDPDKIVCVGLNYRDHADEAGFEVKESAPPLFPKYTTALVGPEAPIVLPAASSKIDYEGELAIAIGSACKDVEAGAALAHVAGAMVFNDVSARDLQVETGQLLNGKALDTFAPCGPALVLMDEIADLQALEITTRVNEELVQRASTAQMIFSTAEIVAFVSSLMTLHPGDVIATGTPAGVGAAMDPPRFLSAGDVVEVTVEGLGSIRNPVESERSGVGVGAGQAGAGG